jgi:heat shock protein HslJ
MRNYPDRFVRHSSRFALFPLCMLLAAGCASTSLPRGPVPDLGGSRWTVVSIDGSAPVRGEEPLSVEFGVDGRVSGNSGCNGYSGPYIRDEATLRIGELLSTRRACADEDRQRQETRLLAILEGETRLRREQDDRVSLRSDAGSLVLAPSGYR